MATSIAMVTALDCDLGENGRLRYTIISGPSVFSLDGECMAEVTYLVRDYLFIFYSRVRCNSNFDLIGL